MNDGILRDILFIGGVADGQRMSIKGGKFIDVPVYGENFAVHRYIVAPIATPGNVQHAWIAYLPESEEGALTMLTRGYSANALARKLVEAWPDLDEAIRCSLCGASSSPSEWQRRDDLRARLTALYAEVRKYVD